MLKITKGLKKKKKDKKGKHKQEELFEEAELEQYRKEQEEKRRQQAEAGEEEGENKDKSEEWEKFKALTSGVDDILKKTQGDLNRIKSTSYFQRKPTPSELATEKEQTQNAGGANLAQEKSEKKDKKWVGFEDRTVDLADEEGAQQYEKESIPTVSITTHDTETEGQENLKQEQEANYQEQFSSEEEEEEDIFDTSYVDAVASGEVKLAYIPDSPIESEEGFDPFDTSIVDQVIKEEPVEKKRRELVSLGCAVDVLTGKVEKPSCISSDIKQKRSPRRQKPRDLLLASFDEGENQETGHIADVESEPIKTLLDDGPLDNEDVQLDLSINLAPTLPTSSVIQPEDDKPESLSQIQSILNEFDAISNEDHIIDEKLSNGQLQEEESNNLEDDEFAELAAAALTKEVTSSFVPQSEYQPSDDNILKPDRPAPPVIQTDEQDNSKEDDPFDTSFAAEILPGKCELKLIEEEILKSTCIEQVSAITVQIQKQTTVNLRSSLVFDDDNNVQTPLSFKHRDLLGGSTTDLSKITHSPIEPSLISDKVDQAVSYCDPFDTSIVNDLVAPGKAELKFLEKELLNESISVNVNVEDDDSFDPREELPLRRKSVTRPEQLLLKEKRQSLPKVVAFTVELPVLAPDLLSDSNNDSSKSVKPLTPYYPEPKLIEKDLPDEREQDPFDTSYVSSTPGKLELKLIESELAGVVEVKPVPVLQRELSDLEFDPRASEPSTFVTIQHPEDNNIKEQIIDKIDILSEDVEAGSKLHTPVVPKKIKEELDLSYSDPFDTSIAQHILPGKAELKLLENELIEAGSIKRSYTDPDFDPRIEPVQAEAVVIQRPAELDFTQQPITDQVVEKPLTPLSASATFSSKPDEIDDYDPFDTTRVGSLIPGKVELKLLESELIHN